MSEVNTVAVLGTCVIGTSRVSLFPATGFKVRAYDPADQNGSNLRAFISNAWPALEPRPDLGWQPRQLHSAQQCCGSRQGSNSGTRLIRHT